jgi:hypothetical protein
MDPHGTSGQIQPNPAKKTKHMAYSGHIRSNHLGVKLQSGEPNGSSGGFVDFGSFALEQPCPGEMPGKIPFQRGDF